MEDLTIRRLQEGDGERLAAGFTAMGWSKPLSLFQGYLEAQRRGERDVRVAIVDGTPVGYVTILWTSRDRVLRAERIPELEDLNVLEGYRGRGVGTALMIDAEERVSRRNDVVGLRVGLHSGYGAAQRLYASRGYRPDGAGAVLDGVPVPEGALIPLDDDVTLRLTKWLG